MTAAPSIYIIAEIASAHEGDPALARRLFAAAAGSGADAVKFQIFNRAALLSRRHPKYGSFGEIELPAEAWAAILGEAAGAPAAVIVEAFDGPSLVLAEASGAVAAYKLPTSDIDNASLQTALAATGKPLFLGLGGALEPEIERAVARLKAGGAGPITLMHGFQSYPTKLEDTHLARLTALSKAFGLPVGFADHVDAEDRELARLVPAMALAAGATVIEKHITLDRSARGRDHYSALNPDEFADFVTLMRDLAAALGQADGPLSAAEQTYRHQVKRYAVAAQNLSAGTALDTAHVAYKRTGTPGLSPDDIERLTGQALRRDRAADDPLLEEDFA